LYTFKESGINFKEPIPGLLKRLQIRALDSTVHRARICKRLQIRALDSKVHRNGEIEEADRPKTVVGCKFEF
jgi:hypothetical protein